VTEANEWGMGGVSLLGAQVEEGGKNAWKLRGLARHTDKATPVRESAFLLCQGITRCELPQRDQQQRRPSELKSAELRTSRSVQAAGRGMAVRHPPHASH
jgi:hypothetical protein